jgi:sarcosine oxidase
VVVVGLGAMGSAALYALARRHVHVIGIDRFDPPHERGSSHGESRVFRMAYYEDPAYVPLLRLALHEWRKLEAYTGEQVLTVTGILEAGFRGAPHVLNSLRSSIQHQLPHEILTASEVNNRFPAFCLPGDWDCVFQPDGGVLLPEKAIRLFLKAAQTSGAQVRTHTRVRHIHPIGDRIEVVLESGQTIESNSVVIAAGPWISQLLPELGAHLQLTRQPLVWFRPKRPDLVAQDRMPVFSLQTETDSIYGFPDFLGSGVKVASHLSGGALASADAARWEVSGEEIAALRAALGRYVPAAAGESSHATPCTYTRATDEHFVLGLHPDHPKIVVASPCSGHGFKFASILGEVLADLATSQHTAKALDLFRPERFMKATTAHRPSGSPE